MENRNTEKKWMSVRRLRPVDIGLSCSTTPTEVEGDEEEDRETE